jgi:hypothetical protein
VFEVDYVVVFRDLPFRQSWPWRLLRSGFQHVELWREVVPGAWLRFDTAMELLSVEVYGDPPTALIDWTAILHYSAVVTPGRIRQPWRAGPSTCVDLAAAFLGVRLPFYVRTPYSLYKFLKRQHGTQSTKAAAGRP